MENDRLSMMAVEFVRKFGSEPTLWVQAPGRVDLMGSHTDYNHGYVLTMALEQDTWIAVRPRQDHRVTVYSLNVNGCAEFDLDEIGHDVNVPWTNYMRGVAVVLQSEGYKLPGFDGLVHSTIPLSSGLSSSAALEVATAGVFNRLGDLGMDPVKIAVLCQRAENQFVGMNCGILDQYTSSVCERGSALLLDCRSLTSESVGVHPDLRVAICDTRAKRELTGSEYPERRAQCELGAQELAKYYPGVTHLRDVSLEQFAAYEKDLPELAAKRSRFILEENQRVLDLAKVLPAGDRDSICSLTQASFAGAREGYAIVTPEMEKMMQAMMGAPGAVGARQAGAGFGGCMVAIVERDAIEQFVRHVIQSYSGATRIQPKVYLA